MANFKRFSRYTGGVVIKNRSDVEFLTLPRRLDLEESDGDIFITVTQVMEKRPDLIAAAVYQIPELWWVICQFNEIQDPTSDIASGQVLRIPELTRVIDKIEELET